MSALAADGAALVAAAVDAAIKACAPRRTVAAVAAAVAGTCLSAAARPCVATKPKVCTQDAQSAAGETDDPAQLLETLRAVRRTQRHRKKEKRRAAKQAAAEAPAPPLQSFDGLQPDVAATHSIAGAAGPSADLGGSLAAAPAPAPARPPDHSSSTDPVGLPLQLLQAPHAALSAAGSLESLLSAAPSTAKPESPAAASEHRQLHVATASGNASAGMPHSVRSTPYRPHRTNNSSKPGRQ